MTTTIPQWRPRMASLHVVAVVDRLQEAIERHIWSQPGHRREYAVRAEVRLPSSLLTTQGSLARLETLFGCLLKEAMPDLRTVYVKQDEDTFDVTLAVHVSGTRQVINRQTGRPESGPPTGLFLRKRKEVIKRMKKAMKTIRRRLLLAEACGNRRKDD